MKESKKSLRSYFILVGLISFYSIYKNIDLIKENIFILISALISLIFGLLFFYFGIKIDTFLPKPKLIINTLYLDIVVLIISGLIMIVFSPDSSIVASMIAFLVGIFINIYLIVNVKRLSQEENTIQVDDDKWFSFRRIFITVGIIITILILAFIVLVLFQSR